MNRIMDKTNPKARLKNFHKYGSKTGNLTIPFNSMTTDNKFSSIEQRTYLTLYPRKELFTKGKTWDLQRLSNSIKVAVKSGWP